MNLKQGLSNTRSAERAHTIFHCGVIDSLYCSLLCRKEDGNGFDTTNAYAVCIALLLSLLQKLDCISGGRKALRLTSLDVDFCNDMAMRFFLVIAVGS